MTPTECKRHLGKIKQQLPFFKDDQKVAVAQGELGVNQDTIQRYMADAETARLDPHNPDHWDTM